MTIGDMGQFEGKDYDQPGIGGDGVGPVYSNWDKVRVCEGARASACVCLIYTVFRAVRACVIRVCTCLGSIKMRRMTRTPIYKKLFTHSLLTIGHT